MTTSGRLATAKYDSGLRPFLASGSETLRWEIILQGSWKKANFIPKSRAAEKTTEPARIIPNVVLVLLAQRSLDRIRRPLDVGRVGCGGRHNGNHYYRSAVDTRSVQYRRLHAPAIRPEGRAARSVFRKRRHRHRAARSARQHHLACSRRLVACVRPFDHRHSPCDHDHRDSVRLGAPETCGAGAVANRENDCACGHGAAALLSLLRSRLGRPTLSGLLSSLRALAPPAGGILA